MSIVSSQHSGNLAVKVFRHLSIQLFCRGWPAIFFDSLCYHINHSLVEITAHDAQFLVAEATCSQQVSGDNTCSASIIKDYCIGWWIGKQAAAGKQSSGRRTGSCLRCVLGYWLSRSIVLDYLRCESTTSSCEFGKVCHIVGQKFTSS